MRYKILAMAVLVSLSVSAYANKVSVEKSLTHTASPFSVDETVNRFEQVIDEKGFVLFVTVDHQRNASSAELALRPTKLVVFGNPKVGTLLMQCSQKAAIDLPQKMLVWEDADKKVWMSYNNPNYIKQRHKLKDCGEAVDKITNALKALVTATLKKEK